MRIVSLVPAATEALFALGLGDSVVGVTHECDWPAEARARPSVTASALDLSDLTSAQIDDAVSESVLNGRPLYAVDAERWTDLEPDVVVAQELCAVCAVTRDDVAGVLTASRVDADVVDFSPTTLDGVLSGLADLGGRFGAEGAADELTAGMRARLARVRSALADVESSPRVFFCEWLEPPYVGGHWVPDMIALAGGTDVAGMAGEPSFKVRWSEVAEREPDVVVIAPCGFDLDKTLEEVVPLELSANLLGTPARQESRVFAVDGGAYFSRPGPRLVDGVEVLAFLLHPEAYSDPGLPWSRIRL